MNADETIYLRYGGRDAADSNTYLDLASLELALEAGLRQHELHKTGQLLKQARPAAFFPEQIVSLKKQVIDRNRCVECHLIGDYLAQDQEKAGALDKRRVLYPSPDLKRLGIHLAVPKGLVVASVEGPAAAAGLRAGDLIQTFAGKPVLTFADLQYLWGKLDRDARQGKLGVLRDGTPINISMDLPDDWWFIDTGHRYWTVEPMVYFTTTPLSSERRQQLGLPATGFAAEVSDVDPLAESLKIHTLRKGDIILSVNSLSTSPLAQRPELLLKLTVRAGDLAKVTIWRDGRTLETEIHTHRQYFRKERND